MERRLTTILSADVVGYARLMGEDEAGTLTTLKACRKNLIDPKAHQYHGRTIKLMGDGALMEFGSVVEAVSFAVEVQCAMRERNTEVARERRIEFRIGINIGDIIVEGDDIYGDGVNVASRLEALCEPGGVCLSRNVFDQVKGKLDLTFEHLGERQVKNIVEPVSVYRVVLDELTVTLCTPVASSSPANAGGRQALTVAVFVFISIGVLAGLLWWRPWTPEFERATLERMVFPLPNKPSIAVLPFDNIGGGSEQEYFSDGISSDIITDLSKFTDLFVIASDSTFVYKDKPFEIRQVAEELGVRYVLKGSVQRSNDQLRINTQLIDATTGRHLWAERYHRTTGDLFEIQDDIVRTVVGNLSVQIDEAELKRTLGLRTDNLTAYDYYWRARSAYFEWSKERNKEAIDYYQKAIELDPTYRQAYAWLAWAHANDWRYSWSEDPDRSLDLAFNAARKAIELDSNHYESQWTMGHVYMQMRHFDRGMAAYERAMALNPNDPNLLANYAQQLVSFGRAQDAVEQVKTAIRINPHYPYWYSWVLAWSQYFAEQYDDALATIEKMPDPPNGVRRVLAAVLIRLGRLDEARDVMAEFLLNGPDMGLAELEKLPFKHRTYLDRWITDLREAGMPE